MEDIDKILHNILDHAETILRLMDNQDVDGEFKERMYSHILREELENNKKLEGLAQVKEDYKLEVAKDHSFFIRKILGGANIPLAMQKELLEHFIEEHREFLQPDLQNKGVGDNEGKKNIENNRGWTVGPLTS